PLVHQDRTLVVVHAAPVRAAVALRLRQLQRLTPQGRDIVSGLQPEHAENRTHGTPTPGKPGPAGRTKKGPHLAMRACLDGVVGGTTPGCSPLHAHDCPPRYCGCGRSRCGRTAWPWRDRTAPRHGLATVADTTVTRAPEYSARGPAQ